MVTRRELEEALTILAGGRALEVGSKAIQKGVTTARTEAAGFQRLTRRQQLAATGRILGRGSKVAGRQLVTKNPWGVAALLLYEGYIHRDELVDVAEQLGGTMADAVEAYESRTGELPFRGGPQLGRGLAQRLGIGPTKRKTSKANKAVKKAMSLLKAGTKASTGAKPGTLPKNAFKTATKAAGLANPRTPSTISSKAKGITAKIARKLKKWW